MVIKVVLALVLERQPLQIVPARAAANWRSVGSRAQTLAFETLAWRGP
jgi:hypothetical protein